MSRNRVSLRTKYVGQAPACFGKIGWASRPANSGGEAWQFQADDGAQTPCNGQEVTVWLDGSGAANAAWGGNRAWALSIGAPSPMAR
jgi:hypothetical protein